MSGELDSARIGIADEHQLEVSTQEPTPYFKLRVAIVVENFVENEEVHQPTVHASGKPSIFFCGLDASKSH